MSSAEFFTSEFLTAESKQLQIALDILLFNPDIQCIEVSGTISIEGHTNDGEVLTALLPADSLLDEENKQYRIRVHELVGVRLEAIRQVLAARVPAESP